MNHIDYHLKELEISLKPNDNRKILPEIMETEHVILDIGCGIGQTFVALNCFHKKCIGIDIDKEAIEYGKERYGKEIKLIHANVEKMPFEPDTFDFVFSRVSLPYTNIPKALDEIKRVLKKDGRVWMTLHERERVHTSIKQSLKSPLNIKKFIHSLYILTNGYCLKYFGVVFPFIQGKYESWQDPKSIQKILSKKGFQTQIHTKGQHTVLEAYLSEKD